jgi:hypothetical protein
MHSNRSFRRALIGIAACAGVLLLAAPASLAAPPPRHDVQAQLLDQAAFLCDNCFFGAHDYFYCFGTDSMVLIGVQRTPVVNWWDKTKNYLTEVHPSWKQLDAPTEMVSISYDDKHIWVNRADQDAVKKAGGRLHAVIKESKDVRLLRDEKHDVFTNKRCQDAVRAKVR